MILFQNLQAVYTGGCFFGAADQVLPGICSGGMEKVYQVSAVINNDIRHMVQGFVQEHGIFIIGAAMPCIHSNSVFHQSCCNGILGGQRIASCTDDIGTGSLQRKGQVSRFGFQMDGHDNGFTFKGLIFDKFFPKCIQGRHEFGYPADTLFPIVRQ